MPSLDAGSCRLLMCWPLWHDAAGGEHPTVPGGSLAARDASTDVDGAQANGGGWQAFPTQPGWHKP